MSPENRKSNSSTSHELLEGAALWRAYVNAVDDDKREHAAWNKWITRFEPNRYRRPEVTEYCSQLCTLAYKLSITYRLRTASM